MNKPNILIMWYIVPHCKITLKFKEQNPGTQCSVNNILHIFSSLSSNHQFNSCIYTSIIILQVTDLIILKWWLETNFHRQRQESLRYQPGCDVCMLQVKCAHVEIYRSSNYIYKRRKHSSRMGNARFSDSGGLCRDPPGQGTLQDRDPWTEILWTEAPWIETAFT